MDKEPTTLLEAIRHFSNPQICFETTVSVRWPDGVVQCPTCSREDARWLANQQKWECRARHPRKQFSIKTGTLFEGSRIKLDKWFTAVWLIVNAKNGISSMEIARSIGVTQKTAWFMLHRIRLAMQTGSFTKLGAKWKSMKPSSAARLATCPRPSGSARFMGAAASARPSAWACWSATVKCASPS